MFSPQTQQLYQKLLGANEPVAAKDLAQNLHIVPSSLYRLTKPLEEMGLIIKSTTRPYMFTAKPVDESASLYLLHQNAWFMKQFATQNKPHHENQKALSDAEQVSLSFIQSRDELMNMAAIEIAKTKTSVDLLRSGHEMSADVMLAIFEATKRNVIIRMLVQDYSSENAEQIKNWQRIGIEVRKTPMQHVRLMLFDAQVLYFMSYKHTDSAKDVGMKMDYPPFAAMMSNLFNQWWEKAEII